MRGAHEVGAQWFLSLSSVWWRAFKQNNTKQTKNIKKPLQTSWIPGHYCSLSLIQCASLQWLAKHPRWPMSRPHSQPIPFQHFHLEHTFWPAHQNHHLRNLTGYHANKLTGITCGIRILGYLFSQWQSCLTMLLWICCAIQNVYSQWKHLKGIGCEWDLLHLNELKLSSNCR